MHTEFGKIAHLTQTAVKSDSPLQREIARLSHIIAGLSITLGMIFFFIGQSIGLSFWANFMFAIGIIVANVPEGLLPTVTLSLAMATQRMAKRNALIRHLPSVEALGSATVICTDKTGTLTQNKMSVRSIYLQEQFFTPIQLQREPDLVQSQRRFFEDALLCQSLKETMADGQWQVFGDPMELALVHTAKTCLGEIINYPKINEVAFDTDRKRLSTIHQTPQGVVLYCKGALEKVLPLCKQLQHGGELIEMTTDERKKIVHAQESMADKGLRVLAFAWREIDEAHNSESQENALIFCGLVGLEDPPRPEVPEAMRQCRAAGIKVIMVTGDHPHTALAIGKQIGQVLSENPVVITGDQLRKLSETQLRLALDAPDIIFARVAADQKMRIVAALKKKNHVVAVTGDGVNDAPALKLADIGISMGIAGTDVAKEAADMILLDDNFATIIAAIEEGRAVYDNVRKFFTYILTHTIPELVPFLALVLLQVPLALTVLQILIIDLGTDTLPALALGAEKPDPNIMLRPPHSRKERLTRAYLFLGVIEAGAAMAAYFVILYSGGWKWGDVLDAQNPLYLQATTTYLGAIIVMQAMNVFLCKLPNRSLFSAKIFDNPMMLWSIGLQIALIFGLIYTPWGNFIFGTAPLPAQTWLMIIPMAFGMLAFEELRKFLVKRASAAPLSQRRRKTDVN
jgi:calcium-translocating P-type ATPase